MFLAARALHPHYTIAGNLGDCELHLGRYRDAAENLARYVRELKKDATSTAEERAQGEAAYAAARAKVGAVVLQANVERAAVLVDGVQMGTTPMVDPLFVEPGTHTVEVEREGYVTEKFTVNVAAGGEIASVVRLRRPAENAPAPAPAPREHVEQRGSGPRTALLIGGAATTGAAAVAGVVFTVLANTNAADASEQEAALRATDGPSACAAGRHAAECSALRGLQENAATFGNVAAWSFIGAGVVGVTTAIVWAVGPRAESEAGFHASPMVGAQGGGLVVRGAW
ncbi:PEGA domain-containing protein [Sorangium sp. So ce1153]|uniref:PEGA domain-containing protein n=1 Tax=Sorangium sp. So ce1153 TaxID=3133333 RepID=UPI003F5FCC13